MYTDDDNVQLNAKVDQQLFEERMQALESAMMQKFTDFAEGSASPEAIVAQMDQISNRMKQVVTEQDGIRDIALDVKKKSDGVGKQIDSIYGRLATSEKKSTTVDVQLTEFSRKLGLLGKFTSAAESMDRMEGNLKDLRQDLDKLATTKADVTWSVDKLIEKMDKKDLSQFDDILTRASSFDLRLGHLEKFREKLHHSGQHLEDDLGEQHSQMIDALRSEIAGSLEALRVELLQSKPQTPSHFRGSVTFEDGTVFEAPSDRHSTYTDSIQGYEVDQQLWNMQNGGPRSSPHDIYPGEHGMPDVENDQAWTSESAPARKGSVRIKSIFYTKDGNRREPIPDAEEDEGGVGEEFWQGQGSQEGRPQRRRGYSHSSQGGNGGNGGNAGYGDEDHYNHPNNSGSFKAVHRTEGLKPRQSANVKKQVKIERERVMDSQRAEANSHPLQERERERERERSSTMSHHHAHAHAHPPVHYKDQRPSAAPSSVSGWVSLSEQDLAKQQQQQQQQQQQGTGFRPIGSFETRPKTVSAVVHRPAVEGRGGAGQSNTATNAQIVHRGRPITSHSSLTVDPIDTLPPVHATSSGSQQFPRSLSPHARDAAGSPPGLFHLPAGQPIIPKTTQSATYPLKGTDGQVYVGRPGEDDEEGMMEEEALYGEEVVGDHRVEYRGGTLNESMETSMRTKSFQSQAFLTPRQSPRQGPSGLSRPPTQPLSQSQEFPSPHGGSTLSPERPHTVGNT
jgi:hypothetical protein